MLRLQHPATRIPERSWIYQVMIGEFLGLDIQTEVHDGANLIISLAPEPDGPFLEVTDILLGVPETDWLQPASMPSNPVTMETVGDPQLGPNAVWPNLVTLYGDGPAIEVEPSKIRLGIDLFGSAFFMLTRYEELVSPVRDLHNRFPASASIAHANHFLDRPIVNEYVELLWACLHHLFPTLERAQRTSRVLVSHDVDWPIVTQGKRLIEVSKTAGGDLVKRRDPELAVRRLGSWVAVRSGRFDLDVGNVFENLMQINEDHGLQATFFMIAADGRGDIDGAYTVEDPWIQRLLKRIDERGHLIGIHPSYETYRNPVRLQAETERLRRACEHLGIDQPIIGGRQHYLRWENPITWQAYEDAGLEYDTTLGYADQIGFRTGVCYEYPVFNLLTRTPLRLRERSLVVMDATMFGDSAKTSMALTPDEGVSAIDRLQACCQRYNGDFTLLWHNTWLTQRSLRRAYREALGQFNMVGV